MMVKSKKAEMPELGSDTSKEGFAISNRTWDDEILDHKLDEFFSNTVTFNEWQSVHRGLHEEFL